MLRLTGLYGDGWYPFAIGSPDDYAARLGVIRAAAVEAGRDPEAITPSWTCLTAIGRTEAEARSMLDTNPVRFWGLSSPPTYDGFSAPNTHSGSISGATWTSCPSVCGTARSSTRL